jgi:hypothetical protein
VLWSDWLGGESAARFRPDSFRATFVPGYAAQPMGVLLQTAQELPGGYGIALLQTLFALAAVCVLAWVYVVKIGERVLLLGAGDGGSPTLLTELDPSTLPPEDARRPAHEAFRDVFDRMRGRAKPPAE